MDALELLLNRQSSPRLQAPGPDEEQLDRILRAGLRAPDHATLQPWRFLVAEGDGLDRLGQIFAEALVQDGAEPEKQERALTLPHRAPMVITVVARVKDNPKVPRIEQQLSAGCALMAMQMAAQAQGLGGIWRTGSFSHHPHVRSALGLAPDDDIVGFLYLGTPSKRVPARPGPEPDAFVERL